MAPEISRTAPLPPPELILRSSEEIALKEVAAEQGAVTGIRDAQRRVAIDLLLAQARGSDGADAQGVLESAAPLFQQIDTDADHREATVGRATHVAVLAPEVAAQENDTNRQITFNLPMVRSDVRSEAQAATLRHEREHVRQERESGESAETPDALLRVGRESVLRVLRNRLDGDVAMLLQEAERRGLHRNPGEDFSLGRLAYRERGAIEAGEGVDRTSGRYRKEYVEPTQRIEGRLAAAGVEGAALVAAAGRSRQDYEEVRAMLLGLHLANALQRENERPTLDDSDPPEPTAAGEN